MRLGRVVDFKSDVLGGSRRSGRKSPRSDSDIWRKVPEGTCWFACQIEPCDLDKIFVRADRAWKDAFGTFNLNAIATAKLTPDDEHHHRSHVEHLMETLATGHKFRSLALAAFSGEGPYVMIDGSHRAAAMLRLGMLVGQSCYVGFHQQIGKEQSWFRHALCGIAKSSTHEGWTSSPLSLNRPAGRSSGSPSQSVTDPPATD